MPTIFATTLFVGTAALALWVDMKAPQLAPPGIIWRALFAVVMLQLCSFVPVVTGSYVALYATIFGVLLPLLTAMWLSALWLLRAAADALVSRY
jgi:hypothetical protein